MNSHISESTTVNTDTLDLVPLLESCRISESPYGTKGLPQPIWLCTINDSNEPVWFTSRHRQTASDRALILENNESPRWWLTLLFWNRYDPPGPVEKGRILNYLNERIEPAEDRWNHLYDILDLPAAEDVLEAYRWLPTLPSKLRHLLTEGEASPNLFRYLHEVPEPIRGPLVTGLKDAPNMFTVQVTRKLSEALRRVPKSKYDPFIDRLENILTDDGRPRDRGKKILEEARRLAYPDTTERENQFQQDLDDLELDGRLTVDPPKNFEGDGIKFSFECGRDEDLEKLAEEVKRCKPLFRHV